MGAHVSDVRHRSDYALMNELRLVDENLRAAMGFFAGATGSGHVETFDSSFAIHSGLDYGVFNIALLTQPIKPGPRGLEGQLADCARFYQSRSSRWSFGCAKNIWIAAPAVKVSRSFTRPICGRSLARQP